MADKVPQSTEVLIGRLRRIAKWLDKEAARTGSAGQRARANTCWMCAGRLEELSVNARAISAAPDLLSALKAFLDGDGDPHDTVIAARAAIAKAEG